MKKFIMLIAAVALLGLAAVAVGGAVTSAQEGDGPIATFLSKVAEKLGVGEDELKGAIKEAQLEMIDEALADGRITEEQAERLRERAEEGGFLFPRPLEEGRYHLRPGVCRRAVGFVVEAAAQVLEMPKEQLVEELKDGKSLAEVAEAQGMSVEAFSEALLGQIQAQLDDLVAEEKLTEEQAERIFQRTQENIDRIVNAHPDGDGPCRHGHGPGPLEGSLPIEPSEVTA